MRVQNRQHADHHFKQMFMTSAHSNDAQHIFDNIESQFHLSTGSLVDLTHAFLREVRLGLSEYNHPMAMMCVIPYLTDST